MKIKIRPYNSGTVYECDRLHFEGEIVTGILRNGVNVTYNISHRTLSNTLLRLKGGG